MRYILTDVFNVKRYISKQINFKINTNY